MFCPNCSQAFNPRGAYECPNCKFKLGGNHAPVKNVSGLPFSAGNRMRAIDHPQVDAGIRPGLKLLLIAAGFFPVYLVLGSLYPANEHLVKGQRSVDLFNFGGKAILLTLAGAGLIRIAYALVFDRRAAMRKDHSV